MRTWNTDSSRRTISAMDISSNTNACVGTGLLDDRFSLSPRQKLLGQVLAATVAVAGMAS